MAPRIVRDAGAGVVVRRDDGVEITIPKGSAILEGIDSDIPSVGVQGVTQPRAFENPQLPGGEAPASVEAVTPGLVPAVVPEAQRQAPAPVQGMNPVQSQTPPVSGYNAPPGASSESASVSSGERVSSSKRTKGAGAVGVLGEAQEDYQRGLDQSTRAQQDAAQQSTEVYKKYDEDMNQREKMRQLFAADIDQKKKEEVGKVEQAVAKFNEFKLDPDHWWKSRTAGQKVSAIISVGLAGAGNAYLMSAQALAGGVPQKQTNSAVEQINREIERDMEAQKLEYEKRGANVNMANNLYAMNMSLLGDKERAWDLTTVQMTKGVERKLNIIAESSKSEQIAGNAAMMSAAFKQSNANILAKIEDDIRQSSARWGALAEQRRHNKAMEKPDQLPTVRNVVVPVRDARGQQVYDTEEVVDQNGQPVKPTQMTDGRTGKPMVDPQTGKPIYSEVEKDKTGATRVERVMVAKSKDGKPVYEERLVRVVPRYESPKMRDSKEAVEVEEYAAASEELDSALADMERLEKLHGKEVFGTSQPSKLYKAARGRAAAAWGKKFGFRQMTKEEFGLTYNMSGDPGAVFDVANWSGGSNIARMRDVNRDMSRSFYRSKGLPPDARSERPQPQTEEPPTDLSKPENWPRRTRDEANDEKYRQQQQQNLDNAGRSPLNDPSSPNYYKP